MTAEERAVAVMAKHSFNLARWYDLRDDVAAAIRDAENEALEGAAGRCDMLATDAAEGAYARGAFAVARSLAEQIRSLKSDKGRP